MEETRIEIEKQLEEYKRLLEKSYSENAWKYFDHEDLKVHAVWNGYTCTKCKSYCAVKNKQGWCIKCLILKEKIEVLDKIINELKGGKELWKQIQQLTSRHSSQ